MKENKVVGITYCASCGVKLDTQYPRVCQSCQRAQGRTMQNERLEQLKGYGPPELFTGIHVEADKEENS